jgi:hypothetical protein
MEYQSVDVGSIGNESADEIKAVKESPDLHGYLQQLSTQSFFENSIEKLEGFWNSPIYRT